jgi:hypothetical protein
MLQPKLESAYQIIRFVDRLSHFIEHVSITKVYQGGFFFEVEVPLWFKWAFGWKLRRTIQKKLQDRIYDSISFEFKIYSKKLI